MKPYHRARREFLMLALAACGAPFLAQSRQAEASQDSVPPPQSERGARVVANYLGAGGRDAVQGIGEAYLRQLGIEPTDDAILAAASGTMELIVRSPTETAAVAALVQAVRQDFREHRSVQLGGWILSLTEAELCLLALLPLAD